MRIFDKQAADSYMVSDIEVVRWEQYGLGDSLPFGGMWYTVPPGSVSPPDCHPDIELSFVMSGSAAIEAGGRLVEVGQGNAFLLDSGETHIVHNRSDVRPLLVFSAYWMPAGASPTGVPAKGAPGA
jgi:mannose-6-phosphate isomerase-like protein (cupin superfamily)